MPQAFRSSIFHCLADPGPDDSASAREYIDDGLLVVEDGIVAQIGPAEQLLPEQAGDTVVEDLSGKLIIPGLIDCHVHFSQLDIIASYGEQLLDWLHRYAYPEEARFADAEHARSVANFFLDELLRNGTTSALVFTTVYPQSVDAIFEAAEERNMRLIAGKVLMDRLRRQVEADGSVAGYAFLYKLYGDPEDLKQARARATGAIAQLRPTLSGCRPGHDRRSTRGRTCS